MKLVRYACKKSVCQNRECYGFLTADKVVCLHSLAKLFNVRLPGMFADFVSSGVSSVEKSEHLFEKASGRDIMNASLPANQATLLAPIAFPPKIICLGLNYRDHVSETGARTPAEPIIFMKPHTTIIGPTEKIVKPSFVKKLDYEAELAIVMGKRAKNVTVSEAESCIFGYTILNDVSARDVQFKDKQWTRGKSFDTFAPTGPCITTANQIRDVSDLFVRTWVNDEIRQDSTTRNMIFNVYEIVHHLSRVMTLEPCDIIATGTPAGVGFAQKPRPKFLRTGDTVRIEIEKIGVLENVIVEQGRI